MKNIWGPSFAEALGLWCLQHVASCKQVMDSIGIQSTVHGPWFPLITLIMVDTWKNWKDKNMYHINILSVISSNFCLSCHCLSYLKLPPISLRGAGGSASVRCLSWSMNSHPLQHQLKTPMGSHGNILGLLANEAPGIWQHTSSGGLSQPNSFFKQSTSSASSLEAFAQ